MKRTNDNPRLLEIEQKNGKTALYLEYYLGRREVQRTDENGEPMYYTSGKMQGKPIYSIRHIRKKEYLKLYLVTKPRTAEERESNRETRLLAERIRYERSQQLLENREGYRLAPKRADKGFVDLFQDYIDGYTKKDKRNMTLALNRFKELLERDYPQYCHKTAGGDAFYTLKASMLTAEMVGRYAEYLQEVGRNSGPASTFRRFKKVIKSMVEAGHIKKDPCIGVKVAGKEYTLTKDVLTAEEIQRLLATHYRGESREIRRAFIFSLYTGIRWCDAKDLRYSNIDYKEKVLSFEQNKTKGHSSKSRVVMPLGDELLRLIGKPEDMERDAGDLLFVLPSHTMCLKALRHWTARAGIDKHITWHCARHTFATQIISNGADIVTAASLLGHSGLTYVEVYAHALEENKRKAVASLPHFEENTTNN